MSYTIGQSPLSRTETHYSRDQLERLQRRCHRASMALLDRSYRAVNLYQIGTLITGYFCAQSMGQGHRAAALLAEACQLSHILRLQDAAANGTDTIEREQRHRVFWHVYAVDITEAAAGDAIHINADYEGLPPLPLTVDDELITSAGSFPQPAGKMSNMTGFVCVVQLWPILSQCIVRHRRLTLRQRHGRVLEPAEAEAEREWVQNARADVDVIRQSVPSQLLEGTYDGEDDTARAVWGMQRANFIITEASVRFALVRAGNCCASLTPV